MQVEDMFTNLIIESVNKNVGENATKEDKIKECHRAVAKLPFSKEDKDRFIVEVLEAI